MQVGDPFSVYTELYGWLYYSLVWDVVLLSGLHLLPPIVLLVTVIAETRERGGLSFTNPDAVISALETRAILMLMAYGLFVIPTVNVDQNTFEYAEPVSIFNDTAADRVYGDTNTTLDGSATNPLGAGATTTEIPILWYLVSQINHGITYTVMANVDARGDGFRGLKRAMDIAQVENPGTKELLNRFNNECYIPALAIYDEAILDESVFDVNGINLNPNLYVTADVSSMSDPLFFSADYYPSIRTERPVPPFAYSADVDVMVGGGGAIYGRPSCDEFHAYIADEIRTEPQYDESLNLFQEALNWLGIANQSMSVDQMLLDRYIQNAVKKSYQAPSDKAVSRRAAGKNTFVDGGLDLLGIKSFAMQALEMEVFVDGAIYAMHSVRSAMMIPLLIGLALGLVVSMYSWQFALQASILLFAVTFLPALWAIASWVEGSLVTSLFPSAVELVGLFDIDKPRESIENLKKRMAISYAAIFLYTTLPVGMLLMLNAAGASVSHTFSSMMFNMKGNFSNPVRGGRGGGDSGGSGGGGNSNAKGLRRR